MAPLWELNEKGEKYMIRIEELHKIAFIYLFIGKGEKKLLNTILTFLFIIFLLTSFSSSRAAVLSLHSVTSNVTRIISIMIVIAELEKH